MAFTFCSVCRAWPSMVRGKRSRGVAPALAGDVEKIAGENARAVRTDGFDPGRSDHPFLRSRTGRTEEDDDTRQ